MAAFTFTDLRPFARNFRVGWQTFQTIFTNLANIVSSLSAEHDFSTGRHLGRQFAAADGRYTFDGTRYNLVKGYGPLPETITPSSAGVLLFEFTAALPTADYSIQLTAESSATAATIINYVKDTVADTGFDVRIRDSGADKTPVNNGFSVQIAY